MSQPATNFLSVVLHDVNNSEHFSLRSLIVNHPWILRIGRGSQSEYNLRPHLDNAWFSSRVMSRDHAILRADPIAKRITLEDVGSMHGTFVKGRRLEPSQPEILDQDDVVTFGADIVRGDLTYEALVLKLQFQWSDEYVKTTTKRGVVILTSTRLHKPRKALDPFRNTFTADYSEEDRLSDDDVEVTGEFPSRRDEAAPTTKPRTFTVPDSDESDADSDIEVTEVTDPSSLVEEDSVPKSPVVACLESLTSAQPVEVEEVGVRSKVTIDLTEPQSPQQPIRLPSVIEDDGPFDDDDHGEDSLEDYESESDSDPLQYDDDEELDEQDNSDADSEMDESQRGASPQAPTTASYSGNAAIATPCTFNESHSEKRAASPFNDVPPRWNTFTPAPIREAFPTANHFVGYDQQPLHTLSSKGYNSWRSPDVFASYDFATPFFSNPLPPIQPPQSNQASFCSFGPPPQMFNPPEATGEAGPFHAPVEKLEDWPRDPRRTDIANNTELPKVSINDILIRPSSASNVSVSGQKRKADEMSPEDEVAPSGPAEPRIEHVAVERADESEAQNTTQTQLTAASEEALPPAMATENLGTTPAPIPTSVLQVAALEPERPNKKIKTNDARVDTRSSRGRTFLKYTATAIAGAAVGAVSTVFGLAALPADYFN